MKKVLLFAGMLLAALPAYAGSTINPAVPAANSPLTSAPIRNNFAAAYTDVNNLLSKFGASVAPTSPTTFQDWVNTSNAPYIWSIYDGSQWVHVGTIDPTTHVFAPANPCVFANPTATIGTSPVNGSAGTCMRSDAAPALPATLPALNGSLLTALNPANLTTTGTPSSSTYLRGDYSWQSVPAGVVGANPTATIGAAAVNGVAGTFMRSDAAPALPSTLPALNGSLLTSMTVSQISGAAPLASPTFTGTVTIPNGGVFGTPTSLTLTSATGLPISTGVSGLGTGVATALGSAVSGSGAICLATGSACAPATSANPTATIGATAVNGSAATFMRSDAAPALPATLPALSGVNLTALNASNLASGTVATGRLPVGKSVVAVNSVLESTLPVQTTTGTSKTFATADIQLETRRSNGGSAMTDTFPASTDPGAVNGARITINNADATASDTITPGSGTSISSCTTVPAGRSVTYVYDLANTTWRTTFNTCTAGVFAAAALGSQVAGHLVTVLNANGGIQDSGLSSTAFPTSNLATTLNAKTGAYTIATTDAGKINYLNNASPFTFTVPAAGTLGANFATDLGNIGAGLLTNTLASGTFADTGNASITTVQGQELYTWVDAGAAGVHSWVSMPPIPAGGLLGNNSANKDYPFALTATQATAMLNNFTSSLAGLAPSSGGGTTNYLRADGTWAAPAGGSGCTVGGTAGQAVYNNGSTGCLSSAATFTSGGGLTLPVAGAASTPGLTVSGAPFTGGSGTTTFPQLYLNSGTAPTTWATTGTAIGVNLPNASTANFLDLHLNGGSSLLKIDSTGKITAPNIDLSGNSGSKLQLGSSGGIQAGSTDKITFSGGSIFTNAFLAGGASGAGFSNATPSGTSPSLSPNWSGNTSTGLGSGATNCIDGISNATDIWRSCTTGLAMQAGVFTLKSFAFSGLPVSPATGSMAYITDQVAACSYGATPVGSGSNVCKVFYNGSAWIDG